MADDATPLLSRRDGAVLTLTLNRPQALNSFDGALHEALIGALKAAAGDAGVRCVVITGAGRGFCAGQDLSDPAIAPDLTPGAEPKDIGNLIEARYKPLAMLIHQFPVPVVAAVNGVAAGAGANFALNCDIVLAAKSASFIQAFSKIGLVPDCGGSWLLPRLVGRANAMALATVDADGGNLHILYDGAGYEWGATFSPDGQSVAFTSLSTLTSREEVFIIHADGSGLQQITSQGGQGPVWVPGA